MDVPTIPLTPETFALLERALSGDAAAKQQVDDLFASSGDVVRIQVVE